MSLGKFLKQREKHYQALERIKKREEAEKKAEEEKAKEDIITSRLYTCEECGEKWTRHSNEKDGDDRCPKCDSDKHTIGPEVTVVTDQNPTTEQ